MTAAGAARADLDGDAAGARFLLVLTHGSGGGVEAPDVLAVRDAGLKLGGVAARVTQPYRIRGARAPGSAVRQDAAWAEIVAALAKLAPGVPLVQGGRSNGARVACRTAVAVGARAVIALAFPLRPPGREAASQDRLAELRAARAGGAAVLVLNGERDPFGVPGRKDADRVVIVPGETHALRGHHAVITAAVAEWLPDVLAAALKGVKKEETRTRMGQCLDGTSRLGRTPRAPRVRRSVPRSGGSQAAGARLPWSPAIRLVRSGRSKNRSVGRCGAMDAPSGSSSPVSSKITTPLQSKLQPCSGWLAMVCAASRSGADGSGHCGVCGHMLVPPGCFIVGVIHGWLPCVC